MQRQPTGGAIIMIGSMSGVRPSPGTAAYGAAKAGLQHLAASLAMEWAPRVRVNTLVVGPVDTSPEASATPGAVAATPPAPPAPATPPAPPAPATPPAPPAPATASAPAATALRATAVPPGGMPAGAAVPASERAVPTPGQQAAPAPDGNDGVVAGHVSAAAIARTVPMGRAATPAEVADACLFLASPLAAFVSGAALAVHGGGEWPGYLTDFRPGV
jgi:NAD(P)-dependent dehydrogenase (short-subunit alcohol dehydrogenase family)